MLVRISDLFFFLIRKGGKMFIILCKSKVKKFGKGRFYRVGVIY